MVLCCIVSHVCCWSLCCCVVKFVEMWLLWFALVCLLRVVCCCVLDLGCLV